MKLKKAAATILTKVAQHAASTYIAGTRLSDAERVCTKLAAQGLHSTICPWDMVGTPAREVFESYVHAIDGIAKMQCSCYLSIKLPSLNYDDAMLSELLSRGAAGGVRIHLDSLGPETVDKTLQAARKARARHENLSWTLPSRWRRSLSDLEQVQDLQMPLRIVKGQWEDDAGGNQDPRKGFLALIDKLTPASVPLCAVATHDAGLAEESIERLRKINASCELEQLFGLPRSAERHATAHAVPIRVYIPYSYGYLPYALSGLIAEPQKLWWIIRDSFRPRMHY